MQRTGYLSFFIFSLITLSTGCSGKVGALVGPPANPLVALGVPGAMPPPRLRFQPLPQGDETPYTPVMIPPDVRRAFVRGHINGHRDLIAGHWWYVRLRDWSWPVELEDTVPAVDAPIITPLAPRPVMPEASPLSSSTRVPSGVATPTIGSLQHQTAPPSVAPSSTGTVADVWFKHKDVTP